jgi:hypothetical protein
MNERKGSVPVAEVVVKALGLRPMADVVQTSIDRNRDAIVSMLESFGKMAVVGKKMREGQEVADRIRSVCADPNSSLEDAFRAVTVEEPLSPFAVLALAIGSAELEAKIANAQKERGSVGGKARANRFQPAKDLAYSLADSEAPPSGQWPSRNAAVQAIKARVIECAAESSRPLSEGNADRTIDGWLKGKPNAATLFRSVKKTTA